MTWSIVGVGTSAEVASGNLTLTEPTGAASGDLLVAAISHRGSAAFTLPSGWSTAATAQLSGDTSTPGIASGTLAYIVRGASAPALTFTRTAGDVAFGQIVAYRSDHSGTITLDTSNATTLGTASTTASVSTITTSKPHALIVGAVMGGSANNVGNITAATRPNKTQAASTTTAPAVGYWTRRVGAGTTTGADTSLAVAEGIRPAAGPTGTISSTGTDSLRYVTMAAAFLEPDKTESGTVQWDSEYSYDYVLSNSNQTITGSDTDLQYYNWVRATHGKSSGKWYYEITPSTVGGDAVQAPGWAAASHNFDTQRETTDTAGVYWDRNGNIQANYTVSAYGTAAAWAAGNTLCLAVDLDASPPKFWQRVGSGNWNNSGTANPATGTGGFTTGITAGTKIWPMYGGQGTSTQDVAIVNFGTATQSVPSGFSTFNGSASSVSVTGVNATGNVGSVTVSTPAGSGTSVSTSVTGVSGTARVGVIQGPGQRLRYVSPSGSNSNAGTAAAPWATVMYAHDNALPGDVIYVRGDWTMSPSTNLTFTRDGALNNPICLFAYPGDAIVFDGTNLTSGYNSGWGLYLNGANYWFLRGISFTNCPDGGVILQNASSNNRFEQVHTYHNGLTSTIGAGTGFGVYDTCGGNILVNCDSYNNQQGGNSDGIQIAGSASGNEVWYSRTWNNTDDGFDSFNTNNGTTSAGVYYFGCWSLDNGKNIDGSNSTGDGNGFKGGGSRPSTGTLSGKNQYRRCVAVRNRANGFDENQAEQQNTYYNNTAMSNNTGFQLNGSSISASHIASNNLAYSNTTNASASKSTMTNNSWQLSVTVSSADFVESAIATVVSQMKGARQHDGSLPDITALHLVAGSDLIDAGVSVSGITYLGSAPDLGAFEYNPSTSSNSNVTGVSGTGGIGSVTVNYGVGVDVSGVSCSTAVGSLSAGATVTVQLQGVFASAEYGTVSASNGPSVLVTGLQTTADVGTVVLSISGQNTATVEVTGVAAQAVTSQINTWGLIDPSPNNVWTEIRP